MKILRTCTALCMLLASAAACRGADADPFLKIPERMKEFIADHQMAGAVTLVGHQGRVVHVGAAGSADIETERPMAEDTMFGIMSMTKPISATAFMILVDEGKISPDDPIEKYIPAFAESKTKSGDAVKGLKVRHFLTHTSGLTGDQDVHGSLEATVAELAKRPFDFQPGEQWAYGPNINVVGRLVEIASGQPYGEFVAARILQPLGMIDTTFVLTTPQHERLATLYELESDGQTLKAVERDFAPGTGAVVPNPSGGLFSTAADMARFYHMVLAGGEFDGKRILSADAVKQMTSVQSGDVVTGFTPGNGWGLGWCVVRQPQGVSEALSPGSFGHGGKYGTQGWIDPERKAVFVLMLQRSNLPNADASDIRREFQRLAVEAIDAQVGQSQ